ncbi:hypothetical protein RhiLY_05957 [Ceratobasidium sp. AG-Ba]|nr:hypothetical protein RhiLY_05957 [Ceratobasidium sp. AG-Ba]
MESPKKRVSKKTSKIADWDADRAKSRANIETRARNKNVRAEEAELAAWDVVEEEEAAEDVDESPVKKAPKQKAAAKKAAAPRSSSPAEDEASGTDEEEARNIAQVLKDKARFMQLKYMVHGRDETPLDQLDLLDLPELEKRWEDGPAKPTPAPTKGKGKLPDAPSKKTSGVPPKKTLGVPNKTVSKTPAKVRITKRSVSKVSALDSPLVAFNKAKEQSMLADSTPVPAKRTRDASVDRDSGGQRPRLDFTAASTTTSRAGSRVPSAAPSRSQSTAPSHSVPQGGPADFNGETFDLDPGYDGAGSKTEQVRTSKWVKQTGKQPKPRAKKGDITDPQEKAAVDRAVEETVALLVPDMCANTDETEVKIRQGWTKAIKCLELPTQEWQMTMHNLAVCKLLVGGFRSRGRQRTIRIILSHFGLELSPVQKADDVKRKAKNLLPIEFLRDTDAPGEDAGHYQSPIIARVIAAIWFTSTKPVTSRYPDLLNPIPVDVIAFACALMQEILKRLAKDGFIKVERRATTEEAKKKKELEKERLKAITRATGVKPEASETRVAVDPVRELMPTHYANLATFQQVMGPDFDKYRANMYKDACKWAGKQKEDSEDEGETETRPNPGVLTAASFAGDLRNARSRQSIPPVSGSHAQSGSRSSSKQKARPQLSSRLLEHEQQLDAGPNTRRSPGSPAKDRDQPSSAPSDGHGKEATGGGSMGAAAKKRALVGMIGKEHHGDTNGESQEEADGEPQESYDIDEPGEIGWSAQKRRSHKELGADNQGNLKVGSGSDGEQPVKWRKLSKKLTRAVPGSDDEQDKRKPQAHDSMQAVKHATDVAQGPPLTPTVPGMARPSSPLSESPGSPKPSEPLEAPEAPEAPEQSSAPTKRATRQSSQAAKQVPSSEAVMLAAIEKRKQLEAERRKRAAQKKKEADKAKKADEANWQEMERQVKGQEPVKPKAPGRRKAKEGGS